MDAIRAGLIRVADDFSLAVQNAARVARGQSAQSVVDYFA